MQQIGSKLLQAHLIRREDVSEEQKTIFTLKSSIYRLKKDAEALLLNPQPSTKSYPFTPLRLSKKLCKLLSEVESIDTIGAKMNFKSDNAYVDFQGRLKYLHEVIF